MAPQGWGPGSVPETVTARGGTDPVSGGDHHGDGQDVLLGVLGEQGWHQSSKRYTGVYSLEEPYGGRESGGSDMRCAC